jgi:hypothetical protein
LKKPNPYLSVVLIGRNDDYGGDFKSRLERSINWTFSQLTKNEISSEIIFVNYNPLPLPLISEFIQWPLSNKYVRVRVITLPGEIHAEFLESNDAKKVPVLEYPAKNTGICRATGEFILCMNPDIMIDPRIFKRLKSLDKQTYYGCVRVDFKGDFISGKYDVKKIFYKGGSYSINPNTNLWFLKLKHFVKNRWKLNTVHLKGLLDFLSIPVYYHNVEFKYICNLGGDFLLMHKDSWRALRGYDEKTYISLHTDALMVVRAAMFGLKEKVMKYKVFHEEHERRYDANIKNEEFRKAYIHFQEESRKMLESKKNTVYNGSDWGFNTHQLPEIIM